MVRKIALDSDRAEIWRTYLPCKKFLKFLDILVASIAQNLKKNSEKSCFTKNYISRSPYTRLT